MGTKLCLALTLISMASFAGAQAPPHPVTNQTLQMIVGSLPMYVDSLPTMPQILGYRMINDKPSPISLTIGMYQKTWKFHRDLPPTPVFVYGTNLATATFPGPTIVARQGTPLSVTWENHLPNAHILSWDPTIPTAIPKSGGVPTVVHLHGGIHPPKSDGNTLAWFTADFRESGPKWSTTTYTYPNVQPSGNLWYHDHALGLTRVNLLAGLIGAYVINKLDIDDHLDLPVDPEFDRHLVVVDRKFNVDGSLYINSTGDNPSIHPQWQPEYFGDTIVVNGKAWPFLKVQRRKYRFRIINASNARYFRFALSNGLNFSVIGSDSSYLSVPVVSPTVLLAPAEIADVVVDFSQSVTADAELTNDAPYPYPGGNPAGLPNSRVMKFIILPGKPYPPDNSTVPNKVVQYAGISTDGISMTRYITLYEYKTAAGAPTHLYINGKRFEDLVTERPKSGSTELWHVINLTGDNHPLHIHLGMFQAIKVQELLDLVTFTNCMTQLNDAIKCNVTQHVAGGKMLPIPEYERTWKNVVKMEPGYMTSVVVQFKLVDTNQTYPFDATAEPGYVYHCHILDHEDNAMIRPLKLLP